MVSNHGESCQKVHDKLTMASTCLTASPVQGPTAVTTVHLSELPEPLSMACGSSGVTCSEASSSARSAVAQSPKMSALSSSPMSICDPPPLDGGKDALTRAERLAQDVRRAAALPPSSFPFGQHIGLGRTPATPAVATGDTRRAEEVPPTSWAALDKSHTSRLVLDQALRGLTVSASPPPCRDRATKLTNASIDPVLLSMPTFTRFHPPPSLPPSTRPMPHAPNDLRQAHDGQFLAKHGRGGCVPDTPNERGILARKTLAALEQYLELPLVGQVASKAVAGKVRWIHPQSLEISIRRSTRPNARRKLKSTPQKVLDVRTCPPFDR